MHIKAGWSGGTVGWWHPTRSPRAGGVRVRCCMGVRGCGGVHLRGCLCPCTGVPTRGGALGHPWGCVQLWGRDWVVLGGARLGMGGDMDGLSPQHWRGGGSCPGQAVLGQPGLYWAILGCTGSGSGHTVPYQAVPYSTRLGHTVPAQTGFYRTGPYHTIWYLVRPHSTYSAGSYHTVSYHTRCPPAPWHTAPSCVPRSHQ